MPPKKKSWLYEQIQAAKVKKPVGNAIVALSETFAEVSNGMTEEDMRKTIEIFSKVALGHPIVKENKDETWAPLRPGAITVGDVVRVRSDAFTGDLGKIHNGRRGKVVAVRYGDVIFRSTDDKEPVLDGTHYPPQSLEKLMENMS
jgi:hypothetical protein